MSAQNDVLGQSDRDLGSDALWRRSLARSEHRREKAAEGEPVPRSLVSSALADLDGPRRPPSVAGLDRDLADPELWDFSLACARAKRRPLECKEPRGAIPRLSDNSRR